MKWTDIEAKWDAMTRRVQSDRPRGPDEISVTPEQPPLLRDELRAPAPHDRPAT